MSAALIPVREEPSAVPGPVAASVAHYMRQARASNTWRAYRADWEHFQGWCARRGLASLPAVPGTVATYLAEHADQLKVATLQRRLCAISRVHAAAGCASPASMANAAVRETWRGIRRAKGVAQQAKAPVLTADLRRMVAELPAGLQGARDRALLLLGFSGAFRRSELVSLNVEDLDFREDGLVISLRRSKTDQEGAERQIGIPYGSDPATCPFRAVRAWLRDAGLGTGALFRGVDRHGRVGRNRLSDKTVALVVKRSALAIGRDASLFAGHSLRAGLVTAAAMAGASESSIMAQTGHRSVAMVRRYVRKVPLFQDNAAAKTGL